MVGIPNVVAYDSSDGRRLQEQHRLHPRPNDAIALDAAGHHQLLRRCLGSARIADEYGFGKSGENPGLPASHRPHPPGVLPGYRRPQGMMAVTIAQAQSCGFQSVLLGP